MYDLASLVDDVRVKVPSQIKRKTFQYYLKNCSIKKKQINLLKNDFDILSIQRNLKILGIFYRLFKRDNKPQYLKYLPYTWNLIELRMKNKIFKNLEITLKKVVNKKNEKKETLNENKKSNNFRSGFWKRMRPITKKIPKPLVKIKDVTLLENSIKFLNSLGVKHIVVNAHHLHKEIVSFIRTKKFNSRVHVVVEKGKNFRYRWRNFKCIKKNLKNKYFLF